MSTAIQVFFNSLSTAAIYAMLAIGLTIFLGTLRILNFAQGDFATAGGYTIFAVVTAFGLSPYLGVIAAMVVGAALGALFFATVQSPLRAAPQINQLLATFGLALIIEGILQFLFTATPKSIPGSHGSIEVLGAYLPTASIVDVVFAAVLISALFLLLQRTNLGRGIRAVSQNAIGASLVGVNPRYVSFIVCVIGGVLSAGAGLVLVTTLFLTPTIGFEQIFKGFTVVVVAGLGNLYRVLIMAALLALTESATSYFISEGIGQLAGFVIIVAILLVRPTGLGRVTA